MKTEVKVKGIEFAREVETSANITRHKIIIHLEGEIPAIGYGYKQIKKLLKKYFR